MKKGHILLVILSVFLLFTGSINLSMAGENEDKVRLIIRSDDIGSSHSANRACIDAYTDGISRSVEIMVACPWFPEAVKMLNENPGYDVGVHLMLTSEWDNVKWSPLTCAPSITDENGYFFPMIWPNDNYPPERTIRGADWKLEEIEAELRSQIELAMKHIPHVSHVTAHMGFSSMDESVAQLVDNLAKEYNIYINPADHDVKRMPKWEGETLDEKIDSFIKILSELQPGTYMFVEHPAYDDPEMRAISHKGNNDVAITRDHVTRIFTSPAVLKAVKKYNVELISYKDLVE